MKKIATLSFVSILACTSAYASENNYQEYVESKKRQKDYVQIFGITPEKFKSPGRRAREKIEQRDRNKVFYNVTIWEFPGEMNGTSTREFEHWGFKKNETVTIEDAKAALKLIPTFDYSKFTADQLWLMSTFVDPEWKTILKQHNITVSESTATEGQKREASRLWAEVKKEAQKKR
jgi:hypothetical protein